MKKSTLNEDQERMQLFHGQLKQMTDDFDFMKRNREESKRQLDARFQDIERYPEWLRQEDTEQQGLHSLRGQTYQRYPLCLPAQVRARAEVNEGGLRWEAYCLPHRNGRQLQQGEQRPGDSYQQVKRGEGRPHKAV